jgi:hypothetical protein
VNDPQEGQGSEAVVAPGALDTASPPSSGRALRFAAREVAQADVAAFVDELSSRGLLEP